MIIKIEMDNGVVGTHELDERLLDYATVTPKNYVFGQIGGILDMCLARRHEKPIADGAEHPHHGGRGEQQWER